MAKEQLIKLIELVIKKKEIENRMNIKRKHYPDGVIQLEYDKINEQIKNL